VLFADRLREYDPAGNAWRDVKTARETGIAPFLTMATCERDVVWLTGERGLARIEAKLESSYSWTEISGEPQSLRGFIYPLPGSAGELFAQARTASGFRMIVRWSGSRLEPVYTAATDGLRGWRGPDGAVWILEDASLFRLLDGRRKPVDRIGALSGTVFDVYTENDRISTALFFLADPLEQRLHILGVLLFLGQDFFHQPPAGRIAFAQVTDDLRVRLDRDPLGYQVFPDHVYQGFPLLVLRMAACQQSLGAEVRLPVELNDARRNHVGVLLLLVRVLQKLLGDSLRMDPARHVVVVAVSQHADDFRRQRLIQNRHHSVDVRPVSIGHSALLNGLAGSPPNLLDIAQKLSLLALGRRLHI
jgi:hypothetical protein